MIFRDQITLKESCNLEQQEKILKKLITSYQGNKKLQEELFKIQKGLAGERCVAYQLSKTNIGMYILHDINLKFENLNAQIDYIILTSKACYFIETKNYLGNIKIDESGNFIREYNYEGRKIKKGTDSPIRQVEAQLEVFKKIALVYEEKMKYLLDGNKFLKYFKTLVVFTDEETILEIEKSPKDIKNRVIRYDGLVRKIHQINENQDVTISNDKLKKLAEFILSLDNKTEIDYETYYKNKFNLFNKQVINRKEVIIYRKRKTKDKLKIFLIIYILLWVISIINKIFGIN